MEKKRLPLPFPAAGINRRFSYATQPDLTTPAALNVRPESIDGQRYRGGSRPGIEKAYSTVIGSKPAATVTPASINCAEYVSWASSGVPTHQLCLAAGGALWKDVGGTLTFVADAVLGTSYTQAVDIGQRLYFADYSGTGGTVKVFDPATNTIAALVATEGSVPTYCKLCCRFRGRLVLAGDKNDPHQFYMSRVGDQTDWDYSIEDDTAAAVSGTLADAFKLGETITAVIPSSDLCLVFACTNSLWLMRGDPLFGGQIDNLSHTIGIIDQGAWCKTPEGALVFLSYDGLYVSDGTCGSGSAPQSLSKERIPEELIGIDTATYLPVLEYDTKSRGVHIFLGPRSSTTARTHWYFDWETKGFWKMTIPGAQQPRSIRAKRGVGSTDSVVIWGCSDGYVRKYSLSAEDDDGTSYESYVDVGPFGQGGGFDASCVDEVFGTLATGSRPVYWILRTGNSPEAAYNADLEDLSACRTGQWLNDGFNYRDHPRLSGSDFYLRIGSKTRQWALDNRTGAILSKRGKLRG